MEETYDQDNHCAWCGYDMCYEHISFDPKTLTGKYEFTCPQCRQSIHTNIQKGSDIKSKEEMEEELEREEKEPQTKSEATTESVKSNGDFDWTQDTENEE